MNVTIKTMTKFSALALTAGLAFGCASNGDLEKVRQEALAAASQANSTANQALSTANEAKAIAEDAKAMSVATDERINRMFQRSMVK